MSDPGNDPEQLRRLLDEARAQLDASNRRADEETKRADEETRRADEHARRRANTRLVDYMSAIQTSVWSIFSVEPDRDKTSTTGTATSVEDRFYPRHFQRWTEFPAIHAETQDTLLAALADGAHFHSLDLIDGIATAASPVRVRDEMDLRTFIRAAAESPAANIVCKYLEVTQHQTLERVKFRNNAYGPEVDFGGVLPSPGADAVEPPRKRSSPVRRTISDRWLHADYRDGTTATILVGEYKAAHQLPAPKVEGILGDEVPDDFFPRAARTDGSSTGAVPGSVYLAKALCQAYHYMITSGLEYGYLASGSSLVFLRVLEHDPDTLYYFHPTFTFGPEAALTGPRETAHAYLATLCMRAIASRPRSPEWIEAREGDLARWPKRKKDSTLEMASGLFPPRSSRDDDDDGDNGDGGTHGGYPRRPANKGQNQLKRPLDSMNAGSGTAPGDSTSQSRSTGSESRFTVKPPVLPYCTQACLRGLSFGGTLDPACPNVELHRSSTQPDRHPLTASEALSLLTQQLARSMVQDCECLDKYGCFGRYGVLFKVTLSGFGYTLVGKGVQAGHRDTLEHEAYMYQVLRAFQGRLTPVFVGLTRLVRPIPLNSGVRVAHMMLMSHAGAELWSAKKALPPGIDVEAEAARTEDELSAAGMWNEDVRLENLAWNPEANRVMLFDFDQAWYRFDQSPSQGATTPVKQEQAGTPPRPSSRSPLQTKRDLNASNIADGPGSDGETGMRKRGRLSGTAEDKPSNKE